MGFRRAGAVGVEAVSVGAEGVGKVGDKTVIAIVVGAMGAVGVLRQVGGVCLFALEP